MTTPSPNELSKSNSELPPLSRNQWLLVEMSTAPELERRWWEKNHPEELQESEDLMEALEALEFDVPATQARAKELVAQWRAEAKAQPKAE